MGKLRHFFLKLQRLIDCEFPDEQVTANIFRLNWDRVKFELIEGVIY